MLKSKDFKNNERYAVQSATQIARYLDQYLIGLDPQFAILIVGDWGVGKTWFIQKFFEKRALGKREHVYISLFGVSKIEEIEDQIFAQKNPILASKLARGFAWTLRFVARVGFTLLGHAEASELFSLNIKKLFSSTKNLTLVFDDLERHEMNLGQLIGYINNCVEHSQQRAIVLANDKKLLEREDFTGEYEKTFGRQFKLSLDILSPLLAFIGEINDERFKKVLSENINTVIDVFHRFECKNLRTLRYGVREYEKFYSGFPIKAKEHREFQKESIRVFFSFIIKLRAGKFHASDFKGLNTRYQNLIGKQVRAKNAADMQEDETELLDTYESILGSGFEPPVLSEDLLYSFFEFGFASEEVVNLSLRSCGYFDADTTPDWILLWRFRSLKNDEFKRVFERVHDDFFSGRITQQGVFKHVSACLLFLAKVRVISWTVPEVKEKIMDVLGNLQVNRQLEVLPIDSDEEVSSNSYQNLVYIDENAPEFIEICSEISRYQVAMADEKVRSMGQEVLSMLKADAELFYREVGLINSSSWRLYIKPVLLGVSHDDLIGFFINASERERRYFGYTFSERYKAATARRDLLEEESWLRAFRSKIEADLGKLGEPTRYCLESFCRGHLTDAISLVEEARRFLAR